jgi:D-alanyl-D-alanine carboxypeptidase
MALKTKLGLLAGSLCMAFMMAAGPAQAQATTHHRRPGTTHVEGKPRPTKHHRSVTEVASASESYILIDGSTGRVLSQKNADALHHPASTTKIMTAICVWDAIRGGRLSLDSVITISRHAASQQNSALDRSLKAGSQITVREALNLVAVASSNDLAAALAEAVAGTESDFAGVMNRKAVELGMNRSHFVNASGLPDERQVTTAADMARLVETVLTDYKDMMPFFAQKSVVYNGVTYDNHNHLLSGDEPYDGMDFGKTGYFHHAGSSLAASATKGGKRILAVILKAPTAAQRDKDMRTLLNEGFDILAAPKTPDNAPEPRG